MRRFIPVLEDVAWLESTGEPAGVFFRTLAADGHFRGCTDLRTGLYAATADGRLLGSLAGGEVLATADFLMRALAAFDALPGSPAVAEGGRVAPALTAGDLSLWALSRPVPGSLDLSGSPHHPVRRWFVVLSERDGRALLPEDLDRIGGRQPWPPALVRRIAGGHRDGSPEADPPLAIVTEISKSGPRFVAGRFVPTNLQGDARVAEGDWVYDRRDRRFWRWDLVVLTVSTSGEASGSLLRRGEAQARPDR